MALKSCKNIEDLPSKELEQYKISMTRLFQNFGNDSRLTSAIKHLQRRCRLLHWLSRLL